jgi:DDE family transposase
VRLFKLVATNGDIAWVITNSPDETFNSQVAQEVSNVRWQVEELHHSLKQLTGTEKCQCRKGRSQRNHMACCYHAWLSLKVHAQQLGKTLYQTKHDLFSDYLRAELHQPQIQAFLPA